MAAVALVGWTVAIGGAGVAPVLARGDWTRGAQAPRRAEDHSERLASRSEHTAGSRSEPMVFGIYPGGAAGTVGPSGPVKPEDPAERLRALQQLRPARRPFLVRLYAAYYGRGEPSAADQLGQEVADYAGAGFQVELALTYRPQTGGSPSDVAGFVEFARETVRSLGPNPGFVSLQITNEANVGGAPNLADGYYHGALDALVDGIVAAKREIRRDRLTRLKVGFNWAYVTANSEQDFWRYLVKHGGRSFHTALDWVGFDVYPGTWGPPLGGGSLSAGTTTFINQALGHLIRNLRLAGIPAGIPLHVSESGYPTGPARTEAMQAESMKAAIDALHSARRTYNITNYTWFDLRDADSSSDSFQSQYGILRDDYSPKPAFAVYRSLIAKLSGR